jgi:hypothetical protein
MYRDLVGMPKEETPLGIFNLLDGKIILIWFLTK